MEYSVPGMRAAYVCLLAEVMSLLGDILFWVVSLQFFSSPASILVLATESLGIEGIYDRWSLVKISDQLSCNTLAEK